MTRLASSSPGRFGPGSSLLLIALAVGGVVIACSGDQSGPPEADDPLGSASQFCAEYAQVVCTQAVADACGGEVDGCVPSQETFCRERVQAVDYQRRVEISDEELSAEDCLENARKAYEDLVITPQEREQVLLFASDACGAVAGTVGDPAAEGEACFSQSECASGLSCLGGRCQQVQELGEGQACGSDPATRCEAGLFCDEICRVQRGVGDDCTVASACRPGLVCDGGVCQGESRGAAGDRCSRGNDCQSGLNCINEVCATPGSELDECRNDADCQTGLICSRVCLKQIELTRLEQHCETLRAQ